MIRIKQTMSYFQMHFKAMWDIIIYWNKRMHNYIPHEKIKHRYTNGHIHTKTLRHEIYLNDNNGYYDY